MKWILTLGLLLTLGCATAPLPSQADHFFEAGSFALAIPAYESFLERYPTSTERERALYRLAVSSSLILRQPDAELTSSKTLPRSPQSYLETLLEEYPSSPFRHEARALLELHQGLDALRGSIADRTRTLRRLLLDTTQLQADFDRLEGEKEGAIDDLDAQLTALRQKMQARDQEVSAQEQQIARLRKELEMLKRIDTGGP